MRQLGYLFLSVLIILQLLNSCAQPSAPQGGPKDTRPPRLHPKKYSTPNEITNFDYNQVILTFDEWVKLQQAYNQVIISPPLDERPEIKVRNKSIVVKWKEELKENTTYLIQYGDAIQDITESNEVKNMVRVFATGDYIDSLSVQGQIIDAKTRQPVEDALVMLYKDLRDSVPLLERPYYFNKTNDKGAFRIDYVGTGRYQIFALVDQNSDYKYNLANETIAFLDSSFVINDTLQPILRLRMFDEQESLQLLKYDLRHFGGLYLKFNQDVYSPIQVTPLDTISSYLATIVQAGDSALVWFDANIPKLVDWSFEIRNDAENFVDTIFVAHESRDSFLENGLPIRWVNKTATPLATPRPLNENVQVKIKGGFFNTAPLKQAPAKPIEINFTHPLQLWDSTKTLFYIDSLVTKIDSLGDLYTIDTFVLTQKLPLNVDSLNPTLGYLQYDWLEKRKYKIELYPNALTDKWGRKNIDTLAQVYEIEPKNKYGNLKAMVTELDSSMQYIIQLIDSKESIIQSQIVNNTQQTTIQYSNLPAMNYTVRIIHDNLANGKWDTGNYLQKRQAEAITNSKQITLKEGWENEIEISIKETSVSSNSDSKKGLSTGQKRKR